MKGACLGSRCFHSAEVNLIHGSLLGHRVAQLFSVSGQQHRPGCRVQGQDFIQRAPLHHGHHQANELGKGCLALLKLCLLPGSAR